MNITFEEILNVLGAIADIALITLTILVVAGIVTFTYAIWKSDKVWKEEQERLLNEDKQKHPEIYE